MNQLNGMGVGGMEKQFSDIHDMHEDYVNNLPTMPFPLPFRILFPHRQWLRKATRRNTLRKKEAWWRKCGTKTERQHAAETRRERERERKKRERKKTSSTKFNWIALRAYFRLYDGINCGNCFICITNMIEKYFKYLILIRFAKDFGEVKAGTIHFFFHFHRFCQ